MNHRWTFLLAVALVLWGVVSDRVATGQTAEPLVANDAAVDDFSVADMSYKDQGLRVYRKSPSKTLMDAGPFSYELGASVRLFGPTLYNAEENETRFEIVMEQPSEESRVRARKTLGILYGEGSGIDDGLLKPIDTVAYEVFIEAGGKREKLAESEGNPNLARHEARIIVRKPIQNERIREALRTRPEDAAVIFRPYHRFRTYNTVGGFATRTTRLVSDAMEKILGPGSGGAIVNRDVANQLRVALDEKITGEFYGLDASPVSSRLKQTVYDALANLKPMTLDEVRESQEKFVFYATDQARLELSPAEFKNLTEHWSSADELHRSLEEAWDKLNDKSIEEMDDRALYEHVRNYLKGSGSTASAANVSLWKGLFGGSGDFKFSADIETDYDSLSNEHRKQVSKLRTILKDAGARKSDVLEKTYRAWTGEDYKAGSDVKTLNVHRVSSGDLFQSMKVWEGHFTELGTILRGREVPLTAFGPQTLLSLEDITQALSRLESEQSQHTDLLAALEAAQDERISQLNASFVQDLTTIQSDLAAVRFDLKNIRLDRFEVHTSDLAKLDRYGSPFRTNPDAAARNFDHTMSAINYWNRSDSKQKSKGYRLLIPGQQFGKKDGDGKHFPIEVYGVKLPGVSAN